MASDAKPAICAVFSFQGQPSLPSNFIQAQENRQEVGVAGRKKLRLYIANPDLVATDYPALSAKHQAA